MKKWLIPIIIILFLLLSLSFTVVIISQRTTYFGRATSPGVGTEPSPDNSYIFASPLSAKADGREKIRVTVFVLDSQGRGVYGKPVFLTQNEKIEVTAIQPTTDNLGKAIYDVVSINPADYYLEAKIDNLLLPQKVRITFR